MLSRHGASLRSNSLAFGFLRSFATQQPLLAPRKKSPSAPQDLEAKKSRGRPKKQPERASENEKPPSPLEGLLAKQQRLDQSLKRRAAYQKGKDARDAANAAGVAPESKSQQKRKSDEASPELLIQGSKHHHDLKSFLEFAKESKLKETTTVYKGTLFEYTVADVLRSYCFELHRTGRSNDLGIDLLGHWKLPGKPHEMRALIQCKATKPTPATIRELEGAYVGAPSAWQGDNVLAMLVSTKSSTTGVVSAVQRSKSPLGVAQIDEKGKVLQLLWNAVAEERGLAGLGVTVKYKVLKPKNGVKKKDLEKRKEEVESIILTWKGKPLNVNAEVGEPN